MLDDLFFIQQVDKVHALIFDYIIRIKSILIKYNDI